MSKKDVCSVSGKACVYWRLLNGFGGEKCCHYMLDEGHARKRNGEECLSIKEKRTKERLDWPMPSGNGNTLAGYKMHKGWG